MVTVPPYSSFGFLALGGDCHFSFRNPGASSTVRKKVKMSLQGWHGDLVIVRTYGAPLEVGFKLSAFGFGALNRRGDLAEYPLTVTSSQLLSLARSTLERTLEENPASLYLSQTSQKRNTSLRKLIRNQLRDRPRRRNFQPKNRGGC